MYRLITGWPSSTKQSHVKGMPTR